MYRLLLTDDSFRELNIPLNPADRRELETRIRKSEILDPIPTWRSYVLMGYDQYELCMKYHRAFRWTEQFFARKGDAVAWVCRQQLKRGDITWTAKAWLIYRLYETLKTEERKREAKEQFQYKRLSPSLRTEAPTDHTTESPAMLALVGSEYSLHRDTVRRYAVFGRNIDKLETMFPGARSRILTGDLDIKFRHMPGIMRMPQEELKRQIEDPKCHKLIPPETNERNENKTTERRRRRDIRLQPGIKQMPAYDPDAELNGLGFTIETWIKAVARTGRSADLRHATREGRQQLQNALRRLRLETDCLYRMLEEHEHE